jgi:hypothetical protein
LTSLSNVLPLHLKQTFPPIIGIFTEGEGDGIESRLPLRIFSTLYDSYESKDKMLIKLSSPMKQKEKSKANNMYVKCY